MGKHTAGQTGDTDRGSEQRWIDTIKAAAHADVEPRTLEDWRRRGVGPPYRRIGRRLVRYNLADLDAWIRAQSAGSVA